MEEHVEHHPQRHNQQYLAVGNSTRPIIQFLQQINYKEKKKVKGNIHILKEMLKYILTNHKGLYLDPDSNKM